VDVRSTRGGSALSRKNDIFATGDPEAVESQKVVREAMSRGQAHDVMRDEFGIVIPVETVPLPSQGKVYPDGHPLHGRQTLEITAMTAREEDILTSRALIKKGTVITELIRSCLVDKRIRPEEMLSGDRNALMVAVRITGYGRTYDPEITCESCGERGEATFDLAELPIRPLTLNPLEPGQNLFEFKLPKSEAVVRFSFLTGTDEEQLLTEHERRRKKLKLQTESLVTSRLERAIVSVNGIDDRSKIATFVRRMPAADSRALRKFMDENEPGIDMRGWATCQHCGEEQSIAMPIGAKFFWPDS